MRNDNNNIKTSLETQTCKKACNQLINLMYPSSIISNHFQPAGPGGAHVPGGSFRTHEISCEGESNSYDMKAQHTKYIGSGIRCNKSIRYDKT